MADEEKQVADKAQLQVKASDVDSSPTVIAAIAPATASHEQELEYVPDGGKAAWTVVLGSTLALFASAGMINSYFRCPFPDSPGELLSNGTAGRFPRLLRVYPSSLVHLRVHLLDRLPPGLLPLRWGSPHRPDLRCLWHHRQYLLPDPPARQGTNLRTRTWSRSSSHSGLSYVSSR